MFIQVIILAILIGLILKGNFKNLSNVRIEGIYLILASFLLEAVVIMSIKKGILSIGPITYYADMAMYLLLFIFVYKNKKNPLILIIGLGFVLNAIPIFANGGMMPVGVNAANAAGITQNVATQGLYKLVDGNTKFWFLGDIIPYTVLNKNIVSIGDLVSAVGIMLLIIKGMRDSVSEN